jgi:hypothetical protein
MEPHQSSGPSSLPGRAEHAELTILRGDFETVIEGRASTLDFGVVYTRVYHLVAQYGLGQNVYTLCGTLFMRMAPRMSRKRYDLGVRLIATLCTYLDRVWVRHKEYPPLLHYAAAVYDFSHVVARRRWRKAVRLVVRKQRILDWLVAFNQHAFSPGAVSAARVADHFGKFVAHQEA